MNDSAASHRTRVSVTDPDSPLTSNVGHYVYTPNVWVCLCVYCHSAVSLTASSGPLVLL